MPKPSLSIWGRITTLSSHQMSRSFTSFLKLRPLTLRGNTFWLIVCATLFFKVTTQSSCNTDWVVNWELFGARLPVNRNAFITADAVPNHLSISCFILWPCDTLDSWVSNPAPVQREQPSSSTRKPWPQTSRANSRLIAQRGNLGGVQHRR